jgi:hypothetical protein
MAQGFGVFGEFERAMIVERVRAAIAKALAQGNRSGKAIGHPEKVPAAKIAAVRAALVTGNGIRKVARAVGMGMERFSRSLGRCGRPEPSGGWGAINRTLIILAHVPRSNAGLLYELRRTDRRTEEAGVALRRNLAVMAEVAGRVSQLRRP